MYNCGLVGHHLIPFRQFAMKLQESPICLVKSPFTKKMNLTSDVFHDKDIRNKECYESTVITETAPAGYSTTSIAWIYTGEEHKMLSILIDMRLPIWFALCFLVYFFGWPWDHCHSLIIVTIHCPISHMPPNIPSLVNETFCIKLGRFPPQIAGVVDYSSCSVRSALLQCDCIV